MNIQTYMAFVMKCLDCGLEVEVGPTHEFTEADIDAQRRAYFHPQSNEGDSAVGISEGAGDTFRCMVCHALKWAQAKRLKEEKQDDR